MSGDKGSPMNLYEVSVPQKWQAGSIGDKVLYFDCGYCGAKEPEIAAFLATGPAFHEIGVVAVNGRNNLAMMCAACYANQQAVA